jgi:hypothetical protein
LKAWKAIFAALAVAAVGAPATASARDLGPAEGLRSTADSLLSCTAPIFENPFAAFGDDFDYVLAPNGSFESDGGWQLDDGAGIVAGNDPFDLRSGPDGSVLSLPEGSSATSALMCVDPTYPTARFPVRARGERTAIRVEVAYPWSRWGSDFRKSDSFKVSGDEGWTLSPHLDLDPDRGGTGPDWRPMAIRLIARNGPDGNGAVIDDVYVDPRMKG